MIDKLGIKETFGGAPYGVKWEEMGLNLYETIE